MLFNIFALVTQWYGLRGTMKSSQRIEHLDLLRVKKCHKAARRLFDMGLWW
jgi:hypothetical protein